MKVEDLVIGKRYRIRRWEDMENEFGLDGDGNIKTQVCFVEAMRRLCGKEATLKNINGKSVGLGDWIDCDKLDTKWGFNADMLEEIETETVTDSDEPDYYNYKYKPKYVIRDWGLNFNLGCVVKYVARAGKKDDILKDLKKARDYIEFEMEAIEKERSNGGK